MNKLELDTRTDETGSLHLRLPGRQSSVRVHVTIEWEDAAADAEGGWPAGWFQATAGSIKDPTFVRPEQGELEKRRAMD